MQDLYTEYQKKKKQQHSLNCGSETFFGSEKQLNVAKGLRSCLQQFHSCKAGNGDYDTGYTCK